jgi:hypothetical protein
MQQALLQPLEQQLHCSGTAAALQMRSSHCHNRQQLRVQPLPLPPPPLQQQAQLAWLMQCHCRRCSLQRGRSCVRLLAWLLRFLPHQLQHSSKCQLLMMISF